MVRVTKLMCTIYHVPMAVYFDDHYLYFMMKRSRGGARKPSPGFLRTAAKTETSLVSETLFKQARKSGQLNLSNRSLEVSKGTILSRDRHAPF